MIIKATCRKCQSVHEVELTDNQYDRIMNTNDDAEDIFADLSKDDRELFTTGYCNPCWNIVFKHHRERKLQ